MMEKLFEYQAHVQEPLTDLASVLDPCTRNNLDSDGTVFRSFVVLPAPKKTLPLSLLSTPLSLKKL